MTNNARHATGNVSAWEASFQPLCNCENPVGILRVHPTGGDWEHRDGYIWCTTMVARGDTMEFWGADHLPPLSHARAIRKYAIENNFAQVTYERHGVWKKWTVRGRKVKKGRTNGTVR